MDVTASRALSEQCELAAASIERLAVTVGPLLSQASAILHQPTSPAAGELREVGIELRAESRDIAIRADLFERGDADTANRLTRNGDLSLTHPLTGGLGAGDAAWRYGPPVSELTERDLVSLVSSIDEPAQLADLFAAVLKNSTLLTPTDDHGVANELAEEHKSVIADGLYRAAQHTGLGPAGALLPTWLAAGVIAYASPSDDFVVRHALESLDWPASSIDDPDPFGVGTAGVAPFVVMSQWLEQQPSLAHAVVLELVDEQLRSGDSRLNLHDHGDGRIEALGRVVRAAGSHGGPSVQADFADALVRALNDDRDTNLPVFVAAWSLYAAQFLNGDARTEPTFSTHSTMPDAIRPHWEHLWNEELSPAALAGVMITAETFLAVGASAHAAVQDPFGLFDPDRLSSPLDGPGNDPGGSYTTRPISDYVGPRFHLDGAGAGRDIIRHNLIAGSDRGDIAQDEFAIIDHGIGPNGRPTYTINLPGVIDLSSPKQGWDDRHASVRDMDMAAHASAPTASIEDNLYAQMVVRALRRNEVELGANLMLIGHSFGADTVADLAADRVFTDTYNVTHVVAAAYDSVPQLAHVDPSIEVLVLQNNQDGAIKLEELQRHASSAEESISVNTFAHEVRQFDGGFSVNDFGHHQDIYIDYLDSTTDETLENYLHSISAAGYTQAGRSLAIDVSLDESLIQP